LALSRFKHHMLLKALNVELLMILKQQNIYLIMIGNKQYKQ
jgi:hypothetical protein